MQTKMREVPPDTRLQRLGNRHPRSTTAHTIRGTARIKPHLPCTLSDYIYKSKANKLSSSNMGFGTNARLGEQH